MSDAPSNDAIQTVWDLCKISTRAEIFKLEGDPEHIRRVRFPDGKLEIIELPPNSRQLHLRTVADVIAMANKPFDVRMKEPKKRLITVNHDYVHLFFDTEKGLEWAKLFLYKSDEYKFFLERTDKPMVAIDEFRTALKYQLRGTFGEEKLIDQIGNINFGNNAQNSQSSRRGEESLGNAVVAQAASSADDGLPDERMTFSVRMWSNADLDVRFPIECHLDPDPQSQRWICYPIRDSMAQFEAQNLEMVASRIKQEVKDIQIVQGDLSP